MRGWAIAALLAMALGGCSRSESPPVVAVGSDWAMAKQAFWDRGYSLGDNTDLQVEAPPEFFKGFYVKLPGDRELVVSPDPKLERVASLTLTEQASRGKYAGPSHSMSRIDLDSLQYQER
jgi:hypothetical protein